MKLYQYQCQRCLRSFKRIFLILEDAPFACPHCGDMDAKRALNYATLSPEIGLGHADNRPKWDTWTGFTPTESVGDKHMV